MENFKCMAQLQTGSINGKPTMEWFELIVTRKLSSGQYAVYTLDRDHLYYLNPEEIFLSMATFKNMMAERL